MSADSPAGENTPKHTTDPEKRRATYGVVYPMVDCVIATKQDIDGLPKEKDQDIKCTVRARRLTIKAEYRTFPPVVFESSNFHDRKGKSLAEIGHVTFRDSLFRRCFMGTTQYQGVRFRDCKFERCDFANANFTDCLFERCEFVQCTGEGANWRNTEIDPSAFLAALECPLYNFDAAPDSEKAELKHDWLEIRVRLAGQLFRSNCEVLNASLSDLGLLEMKKAEVAYERDIWRARRRGSMAGRDKAGWGAWMGIQLKALNVWLTAGGTSLKKLVIALVIAVLVVPLVLGAMSAEYQGTRYEFSGWDLGSVQTYLALVAPAAALVLGYGFSNFRLFSAEATAFAVAASTLGLAWFAVLIPVLIRKIYR